MAVPGGPGGPYAGYAPPSEVRFSAIGEAWALLQANMGTWVLTALVMFAVSYAINFAGQMVAGLFVGAAGTGAGAGGTLGGQPNPALILGAMLPVIIITQVINVVVNSFFMGGMYRMAIRQIRGEVVSVGDLFSVTDVVGPLFIGSILYSLVCGIGTLLCIIPGMIAYGMLMFMYPLIADARLGAVEAMQRSFDALKGQMGMAVLFAFVVAIIQGVGVLACGFGLLITVPLGMLSIAVLYRDFFLTPVAPPPSAYPPPPPYGGPGTPPPAPLG